MPYILLFVFVFLFYILCIGGLKQLADRFKLNFTEYLVAVFFAGILFWCVLRSLLSPPMRTAILQDWKAVLILFAAIVTAVFVGDKL